MQQHVLSPCLTGVYPHQHVLALELEIGFFFILITKTIFKTL